MNKQQFEKLFPIGSHLCREPMPAMSEMKKDMENLKKHGFNLLKLQENWGVDEPLEGVYDFSKYEELIAHADKLDMGVYLGFTMEQAPNWLWRKYPDCRMVGRDGRPVMYEAQATLPADGKPGPCFDHSGAMEAQLKFLKKAVEVLGKHENIVVWNTWQEIGYWGDTLLGQPVCYCENTLAFFRKWLNEKYGDLDGLNRAWNTRYGDWSYVQPDRLPMAKICLSQDIDWKYFMDNIQVGNVLRQRYETINAADPLKRMIFAHKGWPVIGSGMDWSYGRTQDFLGSSSYPAWFGAHKWDDNSPMPGKPFDRRDALLAETWDCQVMRYDYIRSANRRDSHVWASEFQGGQISTGFHLGREVLAEDMRRWMLSAVSAGTTGISFWVTRAEIMAGEMNGFSLLDSEGDSTERFEEASHIGCALNKHVDVFTKNTWPGAEVAIFVNESNYQLCSSLAQGGDNLEFSIRGWHRILWDANIPVDFVESMELDEAYINKYKAIILPFPLSISEELAGKLKSYVEQGGNLISEACPGRLTEHAYANRGELSPTLRKLFGVNQKSLKMVREPGYGMRWSPPERTWGEYLDETMLVGTGTFEGYKLRANVFIETFQCVESKPIISYNGTAAGVVKDAGEGKAWLLGTFVGHNGTAYKDSETRAFILELLSQCDVKPVHDGKLLLRKRVTPTKEAWLFTNPTETELTEKIDIRGWTKVEDLLGESINKKDNLVDLTVKGLDMRVLILTK